MKPASADVNDDLTRLLHRIDRQLGLAVYRGEGAQQQWKDEARELIVEIRAAIEQASGTDGRRPDLTGSQP